MTNTFFILSVLAGFCGLVHKNHSRINLRFLSFTHPQVFEIIFGIMFYLKIIFHTELFSKTTYFGIPKSSLSNSASHIFCMNINGLYFHLSITFSKCLINSNLHFHQFSHICIHIQNLFWTPLYLCFIRPFFLSNFFETSVSNKIWN